MKSRLSYGCFAAVCFLLTNPVASATELRCDKFDIKAALDGDRLTVSLDTDCPSFAEILVSVSRSYYEKGSEEEYAHPYFEEKSSIEKWRKPRQISVGHSEWIDILDAHQKEMSRVGLGYAVDRIDDDLEVRIVLPVNQQDTRFGRRNENLVGNAVSAKGLRIVESRIKIPSPLPDKTTVGERLPSLDPYSLDVGAFYRVTRETPLMPVLQPTDAMPALEAIKEMKIIPPGHIIEIAERSDLHGSPWYEVVVWNTERKRRASGWVNSVALIGQKLEAVPNDAPGDSAD